MPFVEFLGHIFVSLLVGYLTLTNALADTITSLLGTETHTQETELADTQKVSPIERLAEVTSTFVRSAPDVLLKNQEFQRAAVLASKYTEAQSDVSLIPLDTVVRDALVNIYCQYKTEDYIRTTTGTGFFINQKGVILTNAHVAQFLLLEAEEDTTHEVDCVIRGGDPAVPKYTAELLYISPVWIFENANVIAEESPRGTGERDYALLYVSKSVDGGALPATFPAIPVDTTLLSRVITETPVMTAGYPAETVMRSGPDASLTSVLAKTQVSALYTFGSNYADIFSITESPVGEQGASGGPIVHTESKNAIGLIVTKGDERTEGAHSLRALSLSYIDRTMLEETGFSLQQNMQGDLALRGSVFKKAMVPFLADILKESLTTNGL